MRNCVVMGSELCGNGLTVVQTALSCNLFNWCERHRKSTVPYRCSFMTCREQLQLSLTLSQTTNFGLFQSERVCRRQFLIKGKWQ